MSLEPIKCPYCEADMPLSVYAAAHYDETLIAKCQNENCGKQFLTRRSRVMRMTQPKEKK